MSRRSLVVVTATAGAVAIGGLAQTLLWRLGSEWLTAITNSQFAWALFCFLIAWWWSGGRLTAGVAAGALTGLGLITSYYVVQWLVDGRHAAVDQFVDARGIAWTAATLMGGAVMGLLGGLASSARDPRRAFGRVAAAGVVGCGPLFWFLLNRDLFPPETIAAVVFYLAVGVGLIVVALRSSGARSTVKGGLIAVVVVAALLGTLQVLQRTGALYLTF